MFSHLCTLERCDDSASVLIVTSAWPTRDQPGLGIFIGRQVESIIARGIRCDVMLIHGYRSPLAYLVAAARLARLNLRRGGHYRLVHAHGGEAALAARAYWRAPLVISYLGSDILGAHRADAGITPRARVRAWVLRQSARLAAATITKSRGMEATLPARVRKRNTVLPNGVDRELFKPLPKEEARAQLGWGMDERVALFAAKPEIPNKRFELARAACELAAEDVGPIRLHVAAREAPGSVPVLMSAADCLLVTSVTEGSPNVAKEALACDLPVIATPAGDLPDLLDGVELCAVCEPTPAALARSIVECLRDGRRSNGRAHTEWLADDRIAERMIGLYERLVNARLRRTAGYRATP